MAPRPSELAYDPHKWSATRNSSSSSSQATIRPLSAPSAKRAGGGKYRCEIYALGRRPATSATAETGVRTRVADVATPVLSADAPFEPAPAEEQDYYRRRRGDQPDSSGPSLLVAASRRYMRCVKLEDRVEMARRPYPRVEPRLGERAFVL